MYGVLDGVFVDFRGSPGELGVGAVARSCWDLEECGVGWSFGGVPGRRRIVRLLALAFTCKIVGTREQWYLGVIEGESCGGQWLPSLSRVAGPCVR